MSSASCELKMTLGKLARRGLIGRSGGGRSGWGGKTPTVERYSLGMSTTYGACEPKALDLRTPADGADAARCFSATGEAMKVFGFCGSVSQVDCDAVTNGLTL